MKTYGNTDILTMRPRIGFADEKHWNSHAGCVYDALGDWLARSGAVIVSSYQHPAAVAAVRQAGYQIVIQRSDWNPEKSVANQPAGAAARVWDERMDARLQLVICGANTPQRRGALVRQNAEQVISFEDDGASSAGYIRGKIIVEGPGGFKVFLWRGSDATGEQVLDYIRGEALCSP